jgi:type IV secretion system protein VirB2
MDLRDSEPRRRKNGGAGLERQRIKRAGESTMNMSWAQFRSTWVRAPLVMAITLAPGVALAQASPFLTGANSLQTNILAWATPIAVILVMALGLMAMANRISWGWPMAAMVGIAVVFGAPQMVTWIRGMFGV